MTTFRTTAAYFSGAIVGNLWAPNVCAGSYLQVNLRGQFDRMCGGNSFRDVLLLILAEKGGDFRNAHFGADSVIRVERRRIDGAGKYTVHVWERGIGQLPDCDDLVASDDFTADCFADEESDA